MPRLPIALATLLVFPLGSLTAQCGGTAVASSASYNGSNINAVALASLSRPVLGTNWNLLIGHASFMPNATLDFYVIALDSGSQFFPGIGQALVALNFNLTVWKNPGVPLSFALPVDVSLCSAHLYVQGASFNGSAILLTNGIDGLMGDI